jgi:hypothetical protein
VLHETEDIATFFICVWGAQGSVDVTEIMIEADDPVFLCPEKVLVGYKTVICDGTTNTNHEFIQQTRLRSVVFLPWERDIDGHRLCWLWSDDRKMILRGEFQWPSASIDIFKNSHGATLFRNRPGGGEGVGIDQQPRQTEVEEESCTEDDSEDEDDGFL